MGITASTPSNLVIGAGNVTVDAADVGATAGDNTFRIEQDIFTPDDLNGVPGTLLGTHYKLREEAVLEASMPEINETNMGLVWPGSVVTGTTTKTITSDTSRRLPTSAFHDYALVVKGLTKSFSFQLDHGLNQGKAEFTGANKGMMSAKVEVHSNWDPAALNTAPYRIVIAPLV